MKSKIRVPRFRTEGEEAEWWYRNRKRLDAELVEAARQGKLKHLDRETLLSRVKASRMLSIRLLERDLEMARQQAAAKGLPYQTYIKSLLHQALKREARKTA